MNYYKMEHRRKMKNVLSELTKYKIDRGICEGCDIGKIGIPLRTFSPFAFICSKKCIKRYVSFIPDGCPDKNYYEELSR